MKLPTRALTAAFASNGSTHSLGNTHVASVRRTFAKLVIANSRVNIQVKLRVGKL